MDSDPRYGTFIEDEKTEHPQYRPDARISRVRQTLDRTEATLRDTIERVADRGQSLDDLEMRSEELCREAQSFGKGTRSLLRDGDGRCTIPCIGWRVRPVWISLVVLAAVLACTVGVWVLVHYTSVPAPAAAPV